MGAYCRYCDHRCFVPRTLPDGRTICLATCPAGMAHDRSVTGGHDHRTTRNPVLDTIELRVQKRTVTTERVCEHDRCVRGRGTGERIRAGEPFAVVTRSADGHQDARRLHPECLTDLYDLTMETAG